jgi:hypothetical protein
MRRKTKIEAFVLLLFAFLLSPPGPAAAFGPRSADSKNVDLVGHLDIEGGGMVDVHDGVAYIGHMKPPFATSIVDVSDPSNPKILSRIDAAPKTHSHKARVCGDIMISNREQYADSLPGYVYGSFFKGDMKVGLAVTDVSDPANPKEIAFVEADGVSFNNAPAGVHRFEFDCERKLAYISATDGEYRGNIVKIIDLSDPVNPSEVGRWWLSGQWTAGGEKPSWSRNDYHVHHPNRLGDRLYVPMWEGGFAIVDISDIAKPKTVTHVKYQRHSPTHTALPVAHEIAGRKWLVVFDEDISDECEDSQAAMWMYDITDEETPHIVSSFHVSGEGKHEQCDGTKDRRFGAHQPHEFVGEDNLVYATWFAAGLRVIDISEPDKPFEVGYYVPEPVAGFEFAQSNDVFVEDNGLIYMIDRFNGLDILKYNGKGRDRPNAVDRRKRLLIDTAPLRNEDIQLDRTIKAPISLDNVYEDYYLDKESPTVFEEPVLPGSGDAE